MLCPTVSWLVYVDFTFILSEAGGDEDGEYEQFSGDHVAVSPLVAGPRAGWWQDRDQRQWSLSWLQRAGLSAGTTTATTMPPLGWVDRDGRWVTIVHKLKRRPSKLYIILFLLRHPKQNEKMLISSILPSPLILHTSIIHQDYSCNVLLGAMAHNNTELSDWGIRILCKSITFK